MALKELEPYIYEENQELEFSHWLTEEGNNED